MGGPVTTGRGGAAALWTAVFALCGRFGHRLKYWAKDECTEQGSVGACGSYLGPGFLVKEGLLTRRHGKDASDGGERRRRGGVSFQANQEGLG